MRGLVTSAMPMLVRLAWPPLMPFTIVLPIRVSLWGMRAAAGHVRRSGCVHACAPAAPMDLR